jgi:hypothetical protein
MHKIVLHLNPGDSEDKRIKTLAEQVCLLTDSGGTAGDLPAALTQLRDATADYLKKEWNRVKKESIRGRS